MTEPNYINLDSIELNVAVLVHMWFYKSFLQRDPSLSIYF